MSTSRKIVLAKSEDWDTWYSLLKSRAVNMRIWDLVDPDSDTKPAQPKKPTKPAPFDFGTTDADFSEAKFKRWTAMEQVWRSDEKEYDKSMNALADLTIAIQESISANVYILIQKKPQHPWDLLRELKAIVAPTDFARLQRLSNKYKELLKGSGSQDVEEWLDEWVVWCEQARSVNLPEIASEKRTMQQFLVAVSYKETIYAETTLTLVDAQAVTSMEQVIANYRDRYRLHQSMGKGNAQDSHSAFATESSKSKGKKSTFKGNSQDREPEPCLCGKKMWYSDCWYLNGSAPSYWKEDPNIRKKVNKALEDPDIKARVQRSLDRKAKYDKKTDKKDDSKKKDSKDDGGTVLATSLFSSMSTVEAGSLTSLIILDSGADVHVCNSTNAEFFRKTRDRHPEDFINAGTQRLPVECWGTLLTYFDTPTGKEKILLTETAMVSDFITTVVSNKRLDTKGIHFDSRAPRMYEGAFKTRFKLYSVGGHYSFTKAEESSTVEHQANATEVSKTAQEWHRIMGHPAQKTIAHLQQATDGIVVTDSAASVPKTSGCETCALSKAQRIISKTAKRVEISDLPFHRVTCDLMPFSTALNGDQWTTHLSCYRYDFNLVYTHRYKSDAPRIVLSAFALIKRRWGGIVVFFQTDGETSFNREFLHELEEEGITVETSAPDTQDQNGHSERKGRMFATKSRALRIEAGLPENLWNECMKASGYIANRTPMEKHKWKTPFEGVTKKAPKISHLKVYGSKAYALKHRIPKLDKLSERAHIGYLVGYDSSNIFRIWIPSKHKIIRSRDVLFDESEGYEPTDPPDLSALVTQPSMDAPFEATSTLRTVLDSLEVEDEEVSALDWDASEDVFLPTLTEQEPVSEHSTSTKGNQTQPQLPTPGATPEPDIETLGLPNITVRRPNRRGNTAPQANQISANFSKENIIPEGVGRTRKPRKGAYATQLQLVQDGSSSAYHDSFLEFTTASSYQALYANLETSGTVLAATHSTSISARQHRDDLAPEPKSFKQVLKDPNLELWKEAIRVEVNALQAKETWQEVGLEDATQAGRKAIPTNFVFKYKFDEQGWLIKRKARLVARGDLQHTDMDTFAATLAARIFRTILSLVAAFDLETRQYDAVNAFVHAKIDEPTYCTTPHGWEGTSGVHLKLSKALYGLKQSPALWYKHISTTLASLDLESVPGVECLYTNQYMTVFFFVDDVCVVFDKKFTAQVDTFQAKLFNKLEMKALGEMQWFLGIRIIRERLTRRLWLCQDSYIDKIAAKFNISLTSAATPLPVEELKRYTEQATSQDIYAYQQRVGSIGFSAVATRPDTAYAASKLSEHLQNPSPRHMQLANRVIEYLLHTRTLSILFDGLQPDSSTVFLGSSDASFADNTDTRYSSQGYVFMLYGGPIDWKASKQRTVTLSSTEAELLSISTTAKETLWWQRFFSAIEFDPGHKLTIQCDNQQTIRALTEENPRFTTKLRHVDIHTHWLRQEIAQKSSIDIKWTSSATIIADGFTKPLTIQRHANFINMLGLGVVKLEKHLKDVSDSRKIVDFSGEEADASGDA